jgi:hypothetical protein
VDEVLTNEFVRKGWAVMLIERSDTGVDAGDGRVCCVVVGKDILTGYQVSWQRYFDSFLAGCVK